MLKINIENIPKCSNCLHKSNSSMVYLCNTCGMYDDYPNWKAAELKPMCFNFDSIFEQPHAQWMEEKITSYAKQLQWLFEHYPEQNGKWSEDTQWFIYYSKIHEGWCCAVAWKAPYLNVIYMSEEAAKHLAADMNSVKVRFHESF